MVHLCQAVTTHLIFQRFPELPVDYLGHRADPHTATNMLWFGCSWPHPNNTGLLRFFPWRGGGRWFPFFNGMGPPLPIRPPGLPMPTSKPHPSNLGPSPATSPTNPQGVDRPPHVPPPPVYPLSPADPVPCLLTGPVGTPAVVRWPPLCVASAAQAGSQLYPRRPSDTLPLTSLLPVDSSAPSMHLLLAWGASTGCRFDYTTPWWLCFGGGGWKAEWG